MKGGERGILGEGKGDGMGMGKGYTSEVILTTRS